MLNRRTCPLIEVKWSILVDDMSCGGLAKFVSEYIKNGRHQLHKECANIISGGFGKLVVESK